MIRLMLRRLLTVIPTLLIVTFGVFLLVKLAPTDPAITVAGGIDRHARRRSPRVPRSCTSTTRCSRSTGAGSRHAVTGDLGESYIRKTSVTDDLEDRVPVTLGSIVRGDRVRARDRHPTRDPQRAAAQRGRRPWVAGLRRRSRSRSRASCSRSCSSCVFAVKLKWLPPLGYTKFSESPTEWLRYIALPAIALGVGDQRRRSTRQLRGALVDELDTNHIRTGWAIGGAPPAGRRPPRAQERVDSRDHDPRAPDRGARRRHRDHRADLLDPGDRDLPPSAILAADMPAIQGCVLVLVIIAHPDEPDRRHPLRAPEPEGARELHDDRRHRRGSRATPRTSRSRPTKPSRPRSRSRRCPSGKERSGGSSGGPGPRSRWATSSSSRSRALFAPLVAPYDPNEQDIPNRFATPSWSHLLGTDDLGPRPPQPADLRRADVAAASASSVVAIAMTVGLVFGLFSGLRRREDRQRPHARHRRRAQLSAARARDRGRRESSGPGVRNVILALSIVFVFGLTRLVRGTTLAVARSRSSRRRTRRGQPYPSHPRATGSCPNVRSPLLIAATFGIAGVLIAEAGLAYLGLGRPPPTASWGGDAAPGLRPRAVPAPWQLLVPGSRDRDHRSSRSTSWARACATCSGPAARTKARRRSDGIDDGRPNGEHRAGRRRRRAAPARAAPRSRRHDDALLRIEHLSVEFVTDHGRSRVVDDVSLAIRPGETVGLVGESGSGKTVTSLSVMRLVPSPPGQIVAGSICFEGARPARAVVQAACASCGATRSA